MGWMARMELVRRFRRMPFFQLVDVNMIAAQGASAEVASAVPAAWPQAESSSAADKSIGIVFFISHHSTFFSASSIGTRMMRRYSSTATTA